NTLAFNRYAAGWIDDSQVAVHDGGTTTVALDAAGGSGVQLLAAPDPNENRVMLTLESRPNVGADDELPRGGVVVAVIDQRPHECSDGGFFGACISGSRRQAPAVGQPHTYDSLLAVGSTTVVDGLTISVLAQAGGVSTVQVSGTFVAPASLPRSG